ncbi:MAG: winged helix-turn-helix transcriptional regulator [Clostridiales bacterium]|nr:winged helix-turn-helix transcriptional regulator [Clostridiales bacterium]
MEQVFKVLSDFTRIRILNMLMQQKWCVTEISYILGISISAVSRHLSKLRMVGIITAQQDAQWVHNVISESFYKENELLFDYITSIADKDDTLKEDNEKTKRYITSGLTCREICECPNKIENIINGE